MAQVAQVRSSPASVEAQTWAPQAHAHALQLEERAQQAFSEGDATAAALLAEHAIAAHEHAWVLTRLARAERRRLDAEAELAAQRLALGELQAQHQRLTAQAAGLELQAQVVRGALVLPPYETAMPERQRARRRAAEALSTQGRLLCVGARMLGEKERVATLVTRLDELDQQLAKGGGPKLLEAATELRSSCLRLISEIRRLNSSSSDEEVSTGPHSGAPRPGSPPSAGAGSGPVPADLLLAELSAAGAAPSRDDRGVSVVLRDAFGADGNLTDAGRAELGRVGQLAKAYPEFPLLMVGHSGYAKGSPDIERQLQVVSAELAGAGIQRVEVQDVGERQPLLPPQAASARSHNQRIELVFVAPGI